MTPSTPLTLEQLLSIDVEKVFGASRFQQSVLEAPASVTIITHEDIDRFGYRTLADVLATVRGLYVSNDRNYSYVGVRGFSRPGDYNTRVLLLIDGHRMNDAVYDQAPIGTELPLDIDLVERIEVVRGPSSSLYGTSAFFAVVNLITKSQADLGRASVSSEFASLGTRRARVTAAHTFANGLAAIVSTSASQSDGQSRLFYPELQGVSRTGGVSTAMDADRFAQVFGHVTFGRFTAETVWGSRVKRIPTGAFGIALDDPRNQTTDLRGFADVSYEREWAGTTLQWRGAYDRYAYTGTYALDVPEGLDPNPGDDRGVGEWWSSEALLKRRLGRSHYVTGGVEFRDNVRQDQSFIYRASGLRAVDDARRSRVWSAFAEEEFRISPRLLLNVGVRHDAYSLSGASTNPRAGVILFPQRDAAIKLLFGTAFRAPNPYELFYNTPDHPASLRPERIASYEIAYERYLGRRVRLAASLFSNRIRDLVSQEEGQGIAGIVYANLDGADATGIDVETEARVTRDLHVQASYQHTQAHVHGTGAALSNSPRDLSDLAITRTLAHGRLTVSTHASFIGSRLALNGATTPAVALWHVSFGAPAVARHLSVHLDVRNLLDRAYADPGAEEHLQPFIPQDGRTVRLRATWSF